MEPNTMSMACCAMMLPHFSGAQILNPPALMPQHHWIEENVQTQRVVPYAPVREADVMWARRVWREIDLREKINHPLYFPVEPIDDRKSLFDVIKQGLLLDGSLTAYDPGPLLQDDEFHRPMTADAPQQPLNPLEPTTTYDTSVVDPLTTDRIKRYRIKEDWFFDKQRSKMEVRIIGIAPMKEAKGEDGEVRGYAPIFWLYYPELRYVLENAEVFNRQNDAERRSFENIFQTRQFSSYITKVSNVYDRPIAAYKQGVDALLEGEAIKEELFTFEHDLWNY